MNIGLKIKELIDSRKLSIDQIRDDLGYKSAKAVYDLVKKEHVSSEILEKLAISFGVPISYFFSNEKVDLTNKVNNNLISEFTEKLLEEKGKSLEEKDKVIQEKERLIQRLEKELDRRDRLEDGFFSDFKNFLRQYGSLGSEKKPFEIERSQAENNTFDFFPERKQKLG